MGRKNPPEKVCICESVGKIKGVRQQAKSKMNGLSINTISDLQIYVRHHGTPKVQIRGFGLICELALQALPVKPPPSCMDQRNEKNTYI